MVLDGLMGMLQNEVVQAGITWLLGLLTPAGAFVKACQAIYKIIMWFINNATRIMDLINGIIDSTVDIVAGNLSGAASKIEKSMARVIPIAIGFLASLLGIGNLSQKVQKIIDKVKAPISKAIDWVVDKAAEYGKKFLSKLTGKTKPEVYSPEKQAKIDAGLADLRKEEQTHLTNGKISQEEAEAVAKKIKQTHSVFSKFEVIDGKNKWNYKYAASREQEVEGKDKEEEEKRDLSFKYYWHSHGKDTKSYTNVAEKGHLEYSDKTKNTYDSTHGHHVVPKYFGNELDTNLLQLVYGIHINEIHASGTVGIRDYLIQCGHNIKPTKDKNAAFIGKLANDSQYTEDFRADIISYYQKFELNSKPKMPANAYLKGIQSGLDFIIGKYKR